MLEIEKLSDEKISQSQHISHLEQIIQTSSTLFLEIYFKICIKVNVILETEQSSKTKSLEGNKCCSCTSIVSVDELKQTFDAERKEYERKLEKLIISQLEPITCHKRLNDLEIAVSKLRAERDEYLYEINCLKKQHSAEVIFVIISYTFKKSNFVNVFLPRF